MTISKKQLADFWLAEFAPKGLCCLCGNKGIIDTSGKLFNAKGLDIGARVFCICPNGRALKKNASPLTNCSPPQSP